MTLAITTATATATISVIDQAYTTQLAAYRLIKDAVTDETIIGWIGTKNAYFTE
ncbi:MAG: hypothetical protein WDA00_04255 [Eubacteriales bacterium]